MTKEEREAMMRHFVACTTITNRGKVLKIRDRAIGLRELVHDMDTPEDIVMHQKIQLIIDYINNVLLVEIFDATSTMED